MKGAGGAAAYTDAAGQVRTAGEIHADYQRHLRAYGKQCFDLFCRHEKKAIRLGGQVVHTNASQLEFFRWCISSGVLGLIESNLHHIVSDRRTAGRSGSRQ